MISDSCHSGSVAKLIPQYARVLSDPALTEPFGLAPREMPSGGMPGMRGGPPGSDSPAEPEPVDDVAALKGTRRMPPSVEMATQEQNAQLYKDIQDRSPDGDRGAVAATVLLLDYWLWQRRGEPWHDWAVILPLLVPIAASLWIVWNHRLPGIGLLGISCVLISYHGRHHPLEGST
jgi:hypothetical protein